MARNLFVELRSRMLEDDITFSELASRLGWAMPTLMSRIRGAADFKLSECYDIMHVLGIPNSEIGVFFPEGGKYVNGRKRAAKNESDMEAAS